LAAAEFAKLPTVTAFQLRAARVEQELLDPSTASVVPAHQPTLEIATRAAQPALSEVLLIKVARAAAVAPPEQSNPSVT
jgi:hypothetical protein